MIEFAILTFALLLITLLLFVIKQLRLRQVQRMFREFNREKDTAVIVAWIQAAQAPSRLLEVLDYLREIEEHRLAIEVYETFEFDSFPIRPIRIHACKAYRALNRPKEALLLAERVYEEAPGDDANLDLFIDINLHFGEIERARMALMPRLERKAKGTIFARHYARLLAADGNFENAVTVMEKVVDRDHTLFRNTIAQPQKHLIGVQYEESQALLDRFRCELQKKKT